MLSLIEQPPDVGGLVHVVTALLADLAEGLHADGQLASSHIIRSIAHASHCEGRVDTVISGHVEAYPWSDLVRYAEFHRHLEEYNEARAAR